MKIAFETVPNKAILKVHTTVNVPKISSIFSMSQKSTEQGEQLKAKLLEIAGVQGVYSDNYMVTIERGGAFTFQELIPQISQVLSEFFCENIQSEVEPYL